MSSADKYYGGCAVALRGAKCVAIASDMRVGEQYHSLSNNVSKVHVLSPHFAVAIVGFRPDCQKL